MTSHRTRRRAPLCTLPLPSLLAILAAALLLVGCGGRAETVDTVEATAAPVSTATPTPAPSPTPTLWPTPQGATQPVPAYGFTIVNSYPHDPAAFTQGLQVVDGVFYEGTGLEGQSSLRRVEIESGAVQQQHDLAPEYFGEGITVIGDRVWQLTWQEQVAFLYDRATFDELQQVAYPTEGWGLTYDGTRLIMSDGTPTLYFRDPTTFEELGRVDVTYLGQPLANLNELELINGEVWANIWQSNFIVRIDPATGVVTGVVDLTGILEGVPVEGRIDVLNGIAWDADGQRLFVTGKLWPRVFEITLRQVGWAQ